MSEPPSRDAPLPLHLDAAELPSAGARVRAGGGHRSCPLGLCDGSGFLVDEAANTASDCR